jgi:predicted GNAT superfamily acetyltransferase
MQATAAGRAATEHDGVRVVELHETAQHHEAAELLRRVWQAESADAVMNAALMTALAHAGNYVVGAYRAEQLVGATVGFRGAGHLHSHLAGVDPSTQGRGAGYAMKQHQRSWALARDIPLVCWTFDPLIGRNAYFNLTKLGARATEYLPDFYGPLSDGINAGDASDRLYISWELGSAAAVDAARGVRVEVDVAAARANGAAVLVERSGERPQPAGAPDVAPDTLLVAVPPDIEALRGRDPVLAAQWRAVVRDAMTGALDAGYVVTGISRDGYYSLHREDGS